MKAKTPTRPAGQAMGGVVSRSANDDPPYASAIVGVTLLGDSEDVLAVLRTAVLLAKTLKASLSLNLLGEEFLLGNFDSTLYSKSVSVLLDTARAHLGGFADSAFTMEINVIVASFVSAGSVTVCVDSANPILGSQHT